MDQENDLWIFAKGDDVEAGEALSRLWKHMSPGLLKSKAFRDLSESDTEDLASDTILRLLQSRGSFEPRGYVAWTKFVKTVAWHCRIDQARRLRQQPPVDDRPELDIPDQDAETVETILGSLMRGDLFPQADLFWLGHTTDTHSDRLRILAVLMVVEGMETKGVVSTLRPYAPRIESDLDDWLVDDSLQRCALYRKLYWDNSKVAGFVLCPSAPLKEKDLTILMRVVQGFGTVPLPEGWGAEEIFVVLLRFRNGMMNDQVIRRSSLSSNVVLGLIERCLDLLPIQRDTKKLVRNLEKLEKVERLRDEGLWRRLVFQYRVSDHLPHEQILERTLPAAEVVGEKLTRARLNGWLSSGRLYTDLAKFIRGGGSPC